MPLFARLWLAIGVFFRVLANAAFAARVAALRSPPDAPVEAPESAAKPPTPASAAPQGTAPATEESALLLLGFLQREGRLIDFLEQDIVAFADADVGAAARVVHAGCRKALRQHVTVSPVRSEAEGQSVALEAGFDAASVKLVGNVQGEGPFRGTMKHPGWRATELRLPTRVGNADPKILAPAEVEV
jgi:Domain of unknown function (DUF2760)